MRLSRAVSACVSRACCQTSVWPVLSHTNSSQSLQSPNRLDDAVMTGEWQRGLKVTNAIHRPVNQASFRRVVQWTDRTIAVDWALSALMLPTSGGPVRTFLRGGPPRTIPPGIAIALFNTAWQHWWWWLWWKGTEPVRAYLQERDDRLVKNMMFGKMNGKPVRERSRRSGRMTSQTWLSKA